MNLKTKLIAFGACAIVAGCSVLSPQPDRSKFFILTPVSDSAGMAARPASTSPDSQLTIGVGPVGFPDYLRRLAVVTRVAPNRIDLSDEKRWAEPLDKNFTRVLSENLATLLNTQRIEKYPWALTTKVDYQVEIDVQRFETTSDGQTQLIASWIIRDGAGSKILYASQTTAGAPAGADEASASSALSSDLATLSKEIASRVTELNQHRTPNNADSNSASRLVTAYRAATNAADSTPPGGKHFHGGKDETSAPLATPSKQHQNRARDRRAPGPAFDRIVSRAGHLRLSGEGAEPGAAGPRPLRVSFVGGQANRIRSEQIPGCRL